MSMNYVGSISIIDRGDAPAKAVIDKNALSLAQRVADETKDELNKVMDRVDNIYVSYEMSTQTMFENPRGSPSVEYIEDIKELEEIIKDTVKKKKYQQQVTIFIVGFQDVSAQKMQLLQQVNQFFLENSQPEEEVEEKMELDLEEASNKVNESLSTAEDLAKKLNDLNQDIIEWLVNYTNTKASNKGKKRLEKSLEAAKNDMNSLSEKLLNLQTELEEKDEKFQLLAKQLEGKTQEAVRYKTAAEVAKKSAQDNENHTSTLQDEIAKRDEKIHELRSKLSRMEINLTESQFDKEMSVKRLDNNATKTKERLAKLQEEVDTKKIAVTDAEREMEKLHKEQVHEMKKLHFEEVEDLKREHREELSQLTEEVNKVRKRLAESEIEAQQAFDDSDQLRSKLVAIQLQDPPIQEDKKRPPPQQQQQQQKEQPEFSDSSSGKSIAELASGDDDQQRPESRPSTKDTKSSKKSDSKPKSLAKSPSRAPQKPRGGKDYADASIQDEGGDASKAIVEKNDASRQAMRQSKTLEPVVETGDCEFTDSFDLDDEESWSSVPATNVIGRFSQYRQLTVAKIRELEEQLNITLTKTHRKVNSLKSQFNDHKGKWEAERKILIEQVEQAQKLQTDAEKEADAAMTQLEEFINEQEKLEADAAMTQLEEFINEKEKLEDEEEVKRQEVLKTMSRPGTTARKQTPVIVEQKPPKPSSPEAVEKPEPEAAEKGEKTHTDTSDPELNKLMQQTDDAKSRPCSSLSEEEDIELAPWLTPDYINGKVKVQPEAPTDMLNSRLSSADAELLQLMPPEEMLDAHMSNGQKKALPKPKSDTRLPVDLLRGEKERLRSRTSSKASRPPRIIGSHFDEKDEDVFDDEEADNSEEEGSIELAPWFSEKKVVKRPLTRQTVSTRESRRQTNDESDVSSAEADKTGETSAVRKSRQGSSMSEGVMSKVKVVDDGKEEVEKAGPRSRQESKSKVKEGENDDIEPEVSEPKKKVKRKHKKESDKEDAHAGQGIKENDSKLDDQDTTAGTNKQHVKDTKSKEQIDVKKEDEARTEKDRAAVSRMSETRQGHRKTDDNHAPVRKDIEEDADSEKVTEIDKVTNMSELPLPVPTETEPPNPREVGKEQHDETHMLEDVKLATDEEKVKLLTERARSRSKSNIAEGKVDAPRSRQSDHRSLKGKIDERQIEDESKVNTEQPTVEREINTEELALKINEIEEVDSRQGDGESVATPYTRQMSQNPRGQIEADSALDSVRTPYTRQTSQHPGGQIDAESVLEGRESVTTPYTRQMSQNPRGQIEADSALDSVRTPYTRQMSQNPRGQIEIESVLEGRESVETPYTRQMSQNPRGEINPDSVLMDRNGAVTKYTDVAAPNQLQDREALMSMMEYRDIEEDDGTGETISPLKRRSEEPNSVAKKRLMASVEVIMRVPGSPDEALEKNSRQSGAISAPPAVEPREEKPAKKLEVDTPREDFESRPVTPKQRVPSANPVIRSLTLKKPDTPKQAFRTPRSDSPKQALRTPRSDSSSSFNSAMSYESILIGQNRDDDITMAIAPSQSDALHNLKTMMVDENLSHEQQKTLDSLRSALKSIASTDQKLTGKQLERTVTILSLASQLAHESAEIGIVPDSIFNSFASISSRSSVSSMSDSEDEVINEKRQLSNEAMEEQLKEAVFKLIPEKPVHKQLSKSPMKRVIVKRQQPEKKLPPVSDRPLSGSLNLAYGSSRGDSFSASIPRTVTSSEWRRLSVNDPFSPSPIKQLKEQKDEKCDEHRAEQISTPVKQVKDETHNGHRAKQIPTDDRLEIDSRHAISVVVSPKKKYRAVATREEMLFGKGSLDVAPTGKRTAMEIMQMEADLCIQGSRLIKPNQQHEYTQEQSDNSECLSARSLPKSSTALSWLQNASQPPSATSSSKTSRKSPGFPKLSQSQAPPTKFKNVSKLLTVELSSLNRAKQRDTSVRSSPRYSIVSDQSTEGTDSFNQGKFENNGFSIVGTKLDSKLLAQKQLQDGDMSISANNEPHFKENVNSDQKVIRKQGQSSKQMVGTGLGISRSKSDVIPKRPRTDSVGKETLGNMLLGNRNAYDTNATAFNFKESLKSDNVVSSNPNKMERSRSYSQTSDCHILKRTTKMVSIATQCTFTVIAPDLVSTATQCSKIETMPQCVGYDPAKPISDLVSIATQSTASDISTDFEQEVTVEQSIGDFSNGEPLAPKTRTSAPKSPISSGSRSPTFSTNDPKPSTPPLNAPSLTRRRKSLSSSQTNSIDVPSTPVQSQKNRSHDQSHDHVPPHSPITAPTPGTHVSEIHRPPSIASYQPARVPSPLMVAHKGTQTEKSMPMIEKEPIRGNTEDEIRASSAKSRASLRSQFKSRLDETRHAVEERRTRSPVISVPSQKSIDDELIEDEEDDDLPIPDDQKAGEPLGKEDTEDMGTSPPPEPKLEKQISITSRHSVNLSEHPVVKEYLRAYTGIHNFKEAISRILEDKDQMSASQILADLDNIIFNKDEKVVPQIENMTENIYYVLNEVSQVVNSVLQNDRGPVVSSLMMGMSRDPTQRTIVREKSTVDNNQQLATRASQRSQGSKMDSASTERQQYKELQEQYEKLQNHMSGDAKKFEQQQKHNVVVMMEMQDTINQLQRELSNLGKQSRRPLSESMSNAGASQNAESAVMFTRLDSERNAKIMKKAVNERKLDANRYKEAMVQMDEYVDLPGQRLAHLVRKYVHHCRMKEIEENVQNSNSLNENVFEILDKMEALQNQRAKRWADKMDDMGMERMKLANVLMETFDDIERESGIFLIKPMYSYRGREVKERYSGKISRPFRPQRTLSPRRDVNSAYAPAPTPASNMRPVRAQQAKDAAQLSQTQEHPTSATQNDPNRPLEGDSMGLMGSSVRYVGSSPKATWNMMDSQPRSSDSYSHGAGLQGNTPRILELDINRMMIGQNTISASIPGLSNDRLVNASNSNLRSYMTVNRPTGPSSGKSDRPTSGSRHIGDSPGPPPSPTNRSSSNSKRVRMSSDIEVPTVMTSTQPLPPIGTSPTPGRTHSGGKGRLSPTRIPVGEVSMSPPGSRGSTRQSPLGMSDNDMSPIK